ncbi:MAG TPA: hypothetical protein V6C99_10660 [Oculatellaceae cyanobacterium]|jgi:hypothetical protein
MHVFHIRGFSGVLVLVAVAISALLLLLLLPASFMMVLWNALVFEGFNGPEIDLTQGFFLWGFVMVLLKLIFKPQIKFEFQSLAATNSKNKTAPKQKPNSDTKSSIVSDEPADQK